MEKVEGGTIFRPLEERLNASAAPELKSEFAVLAHSTDGGVLVDLSAVQYLDSSVLSALLLLRRMLAEKERELVVVAPTPTVQSIFSLSKLDEIFTLMTNIEDALKYMQQQAVQALAKSAKEEEEEEEEWEEEDLEDWEEEEWEDEEDWDDEDWDEEDWEEDEEWEDEEWDEEEEDWDEEDEEEEG